MTVLICNRCSDFGLKLGGSYISGAESKAYDQKADNDNTRYFGLSTVLEDFKGIIMYGLERKHFKLGNRHEQTRTLLLIAWESEGYKKFRVFVRLVECNKWPLWGSAELEEHFQRYTNQLCTYTGPIKDTWSIYDGIILMTRLELDFTQRDGVLIITVSEGVSDDHTKIPEWIDPGR
jgi:hypothetical protein